MPVRPAPASPESGHRGGINRVHRVDGLDRRPVSHQPALTFGNRAHSLAKEGSATYDRFGVAVSSRGQTPALYKSRAGRCWPAAVGAEAHETSRVVLPRGRLLPRARTRALLRKTQLPGGNGQRAPTGQQVLLTACGASEQRPQKRRLAAG